jgi:hypothetical protein
MVKWSLELMCGAGVWSRGMCDEGFQTVQEDWFNNPVSSLNYLIAENRDRVFRQLKA